MDFPINLAVSLEKSFPKQPAEKLECHATLPPPGKQLQNVRRALLGHRMQRWVWGTQSPPPVLMENHRLKSVPQSGYSGIR